MAPAPCKYVAFIGMTECERGVRESAVISLLLTNASLCQKI